MMEISEYSDNLSFPSTLVVLKKIRQKIEKLIDLKHPIKCYSTVVGIIIPLFTECYEVDKIKITRTDERFTIIINNILVESIIINRSDENLLTIMEDMWQLFVKGFDKQKNNKEQAERIETLKYLDLI